MASERTFGSPSPKKIRLLKKTPTKNGNSLNETFSDRSTPNCVQSLFPTSPVVRQLNGGANPDATTNQSMCEALLACEADSFSPNKAASAVGSASSGGAASSLLQTHFVPSPHRHAQHTPPVARAMNGASSVAANLFSTAVGDITMRQHETENSCNLLNYRRVRQSPTQHSRSLLSSESPISKRTQSALQTRCKAPRKISHIPYKVLDAPDLQDDFYLNLVDWSATNLLAVGLGSCVYLWNAANSVVSLLCNLDSEASNGGGGEHVTSVSWNERGNAVAVGTSKGAIQIWDVGALGGDASNARATCVSVCSAAHQGNRVGTLAWNGDDLLASGSRDRKICLRDQRVPIASPPSPATPTTTTAATGFMVLGTHNQEVCGLKWSPDRRYLASGGNDNRLLVWSLAAATTGGTSQRRVGTPPSGAAGLEGDTAARRRTMPNVQFVDTDGVVLGASSQHQQEDEQVVMNDTTGLNEEDPEVQLMEHDQSDPALTTHSAHPTHRMVASLNIPSQSTSEAAASSSSNLSTGTTSSRTAATNTTGRPANARLPSAIAAVSSHSPFMTPLNNPPNNNNVNNNNTNSSSNGGGGGGGVPPLFQFEAHVAAVKAIGWSPHNHAVLASGGGTTDRSIKFWNTSSGRALGSIDTGSQVCNIAWSRHAPHEFISTHGYSQNHIVVWEYPACVPQIRLSGHSSRVLYLAMSPCGENIVTGAGDETLRFWNLFSRPSPVHACRSLLDTEYAIR